MSYIKIFVLSTIEIIISVFILSILYYYDLISNNTFKVLEILFLLIIVFFNSNLLCKKLNIKRIVNGIVFVLPYISISIISSLITKSFQLRLFIYYLILIFISILGSYFYNKKDD